MKAKIMIVVVLIVLTVVPGVAEEPKPIDFVMEYSSYGALGAGGLKLFELLTDARFTDGHDSEFRFGTEFYPFKPVSIAVHKVSGVNGWNSDTGFYTNDARPSPVTGQSLIFDDIYMWALPGTPNQDMLLKTFYVQNIYGWTYKLELVSVPLGITYNGRRVWGAEDSTIILPFYSTEDGTTGYKFRAEITAVPEPSSLLALAGGFAGVGGAFLRRRKS